MNPGTLSTRIALALASLGMLAVPARMTAQAPAPQGPPPSPKAQAPWDVTGYWVSIVTEDWRFRMITPGKGDFPGLPLNDEGKKIAEAWDPAKDDAAGEQCKSYGAAAIMRVPGRLHITWDNDTTLKVDADAGSQSRVFHFGGMPTGNPSWQGYSVASWEPLQGGGGFGPHKPGSLKVVTTRLRAGYLRKNGVPNSDKTTVTEYIDVLNDPNANEQWLMVKTIVEDPTYLTQPFITSTHFKKQADARGWSPSACATR